MECSKLKKAVLNGWFKAYDVLKLYKLRRKAKLKIMTAKKTLLYIQKHQCSVTRFGDGEFGIMLNRGGPSFQQATEALSVAIAGVFENQSSNLLICIPRAFVSTRGFESFAKSFWGGWARENLQDVSQAISCRLGSDYQFGDAYISRPYTAYKSRNYAAKLFGQLKALWLNRDVLIVEGEQTRLGVENDLFDKAKFIKRILCPSENAFGVYDRIVETTLSSWRGELVILALGPTATVLASDLSKKGIQALDLGHIDIQYEWFMADSKAFKPIAGKYTNEAVGGRQPETCRDETYLSQIIAEVK